MRRLLILLSLLVIAIFNSGYSATNFTNSIYDEIKTQTIKGVKNYFKKDITIGKASGIILGQIVFEDVRFAGQATVKKVYINYNPITFAFKKDIVPAITKITLKEGNFKITRNSQNKWNFDSLLPPEEPGGPPPPPFHAKLVFDNCTIDYQDEIGYGKRANKFGQEIKEVNGTVSFQQKDQIAIDLNGTIEDSNGTSPATIKGAVDFSTSKYEFKIESEKLDLKRWSNYAVPFLPIKADSGQVNLSLKLSQAKKKGWPTALVGNFVFINAEAKLDEYKISNLNGTLSIDDEDLTFKDVKTEINGLPIKINGSLNDYNQQKIDLVVSLSRLDLKKLVSTIPQAKHLDLKGFASGPLKITRTINKPLVEGQLAISKGLLYNQAFSGQANFSFQQKRLKVSVPVANFYKGQAFGDVKIDFSTATPTLSIASQLKKINLASLSQGTPGIVGQANGNFTLSGPINNLKGALLVKLSEAMLMGQPLQEIKSSLQIKDGNVYLEDFTASSETGSLQSSGTISRDLYFNFLATAKGIKLRGNGLFGSMEATVDYFKGSIGWLLDNNFLVAPLRNLNASGEASLSHGHIGEQELDLAQGKFSMGQGEIIIDHVVLQNDNSTIYASGQTGIGFPTNLKISGKKVALADLKILNYLVPKEFKDPSGTGDIDIEIGGEIKKDSLFTSLAPLLDLKLSGQIKLKPAVIAGVPLSESKVDFSWDRNNLDFNNCRLKNPTSNLNFNLNYNKEGNISGRFSGTVDLSQTQKLTQKYGSFAGSVGFYFDLSGSTKNPQSQGNFWADNFKFNKLFFDRAEGSFIYSENILKLSTPLALSKEQSYYKVNGSLDLGPILANKAEESLLDFNVEISTADLLTTSRLCEDIFNEFGRQPQTKAVHNKVKLVLPLANSPPTLPFTKNNLFSLYSLSGKGEYFLKDWSKTTALTKTEQQFIPLDLRFGGELSGSLSLKGKIKDLAGTFSGQVKEGFFQNFAFDSIKTRATLANQIINLKEFELQKEGGKFLAQGTVGLNGENLALKLSAKNMSLRILRMAFNENFDGKFNMEAELSGSTKNPALAVELEGNKVSLANIAFDQVLISLNKKDDNFYLNKLQLTTGKNVSKVYGSASLDPKGKIKLRASLKDNALGLLNLFTDEIEWLNGQALASILISGESSQPIISGSVEVENSRLYVKALDSDIRKITGSAVISNNKIQINHLTGIWQGKSSKDAQNLLGFSGTIDLAPLFNDQRSLKLDLVLTPTTLQADLPKLFNGTVTVKKAVLSGYLPLQLDRARKDPGLRPTLTGQAEINNAVVTLSQQGSTTDKVFPINYSLILNLNKNVYAVMGDVFTTDLSTIFMNLEIRSPELIVSGSSLSPVLLGDIALRRGTLTIFNRDFYLLNTDEQEKFYPYSPENVKQNSASFSGKSGSATIMPKVVITAKTEVENITKNTLGEKEKTKVIIISNLQGVIGAKNIEDQLKIGFSAFTEDRTKSPSEFVASSYSEDQIKVMLLPDFIKSLAASDSDSQVDSKVILADYLSSRVQTYVFRNIERNLEQGLGLESLTLEYNFGKKLRQDMGITDVSYEDEPNWRVGFVKGLFDKLYIDVRYQSFDEGASNDNASFIYQLTYKLTPIWSIIYYREPPTLAELTTGYQKVTLKAGLSFW